MSLFINQLIYFFISIICTIYCICILDNTKQMIIFCRVHRYTYTEISDVVLSPSPAVNTVRCVRAAN